MAIWVIVQLIEVIEHSRQQCADNVAAGRWPALEWVSISLHSYAVLCTGSSEPKALSMRAGA